MKGLLRQASVILPESLPEGRSVLDAEDAGTKRPREATPPTGPILHRCPIDPDDPVDPSLPLVGQFQQNR